MISWETERLSIQEVVDAQDSQGENLLRFAYFIQNPRNGNWMEADWELYTTSGRRLSVLEQAALEDEVLGGELVTIHGRDFACAEDLSLYVQMNMYFKGA